MSLRQAFVVAGTVAVAAWTGGCAVPPTQSMVPGDLASAASLAPQAPAALTTSLFPEDEQAVSNDVVAKVLDSPVFVAEPARLAVLRVGQLPYWWAYRDDFARTSEAIDADFLGRLRDSERLSRVAYLPSLLMPGRMTIPYLRAAAVRFQCDLILVYTTTTGTYRNNRLFGPDEVRAYCTVEGVVIDVRTGTVPFSTVVTDRFEAKKDSRDKDFEETVTKATQQAIGRAWVKLADETAAWLKDAPAKPTPPAGGE